MHIFLGQALKKKTRWFLHQKFDIFPKQNGKNGVGPPFFMTPPFFQPIPWFSSTLIPFVLSSETSIQALPQSGTCGGIRWSIWCFDRLRRMFLEPQESILHPRKLTWIPKMMVWKRYPSFKMAIFGIYVRFLECIPIPESLGLYEWYIRIHPQELRMDLPQTIQKHPQTRETIGL